MKPEIKESDDPVWGRAKSILFEPKREMPPEMKASIEAGRIAHKTYVLLSTIARVAVIIVLWGQLLVHLSARVHFVACCVVIAYVVIEIYAGFVAVVGFRILVARGFKGQ